MATTVAELVAKLTLDAQGFKQGVDEAGRSGDKLATGFRGVGVSAAAVSAAVIAAGVALTAFAKQSLSVFEALAMTTRDLAFVSGGTAKQVSGLIDVLDDYGISADTVQRAMVFLSRAVQEGSPALDRLGITIRATSGHLKNAHELFYEVIDALKNTRSETERNAIAQELFSRGWTAMVPIIQQGSQALREAAAASKLAMSDEDIAKAHEYKLAVAELGDQFERLKLITARGIIAPITVVVKWVANVGDLAAALMSPHAGVTIGPEERQRLLENMDPTGRLRAALPEGRLSSDVGAWRLGGEAAPITAARPIEGLTPGEQKKQAERVKAEQKSLEYIAGINLKAQEQMEKERAEFLEWDTNQIKERADLQERLSQDEIRSWVDRIEQEIALDGKLQEAVNGQLAEGVTRRENLRQQEYLNEVESLKTRNDAWAAYAAAQKEVTDRQVADQQKIKDAWDDIFMSVGRAFTTSITGIVQGTTTVSQAFEKMGQSILLTISDTIINRGIKSLSDALWQVLQQMNWAGMLSSSTGYSPGYSYDPTWAANSMGMATMQSGGIVTRPTMALIGEHEPEAVIPLSQAGTLGGDVVINVNNKTVMPVDMKLLQKRQDEKGQQIIDVVMTHLQTNPDFRTAIASVR